MTTTQKTKVMTVQRQNANHYLWWTTGAIGQANAETLVTLMRNWSNNGGSVHILQTQES